MTIPLPSTASRTRLNTRPVTRPVALSAPGLESVGLRGRIPGLRTEPLGSPPVRAPEHVPAAGDAVAQPVQGAVAADRDLR